MANHTSSNTFGLTKPEGETLVTRLIGATVAPERMRDAELLNLAESMRVINDRLPGLLQQHRLLADFWDRIEHEITQRLTDALTNGQVEGQLSIDDLVEQEAA